MAHSGRILGGEGNGMGVIEETRRRREDAERHEEARHVLEKIQQLRERRRHAHSDFNAAGKELDAIRESAAELDAKDASWEKDAERARDEALAARNVLDDLQQQLKGVTKRPKRFQSR
jgi:uncharacterized coiled-coil DUF342 family protein